MYMLLILVAPTPRKPLPEEKQYRTISLNGSITEPEPLPCWPDTLEARRQRRLGGAGGSTTGEKLLNGGEKKEGDRGNGHGQDIEEAGLFMSVVVPAYNEQDRLGGMLEEAVDYLEHAYGKTRQGEDATAPRRRRQRKTNHHDGDGDAEAEEEGWEIIIVSDGSKDRTEEVAFNFVRDHQLSQHPRGYAGPWTPQSHEGARIPPGTVRVARLSQNRGKGGAVTHGMRHVRGKYVVFADADGASRFDDLAKLVEACREAEDTAGRGVAVGSRAHMVGSEAVVNVCHPFFFFFFYHCHSKAHD